jgi:hypothetical protein
MFQIKCSILLLSSSSSLVTGFLSSLVLLLNQWWTPQLRLQVSACSTFLIMCDVPSMTVFFCRESIKCCPGVVSRYFCKLLLTIPVAPVITGMTNHFMFHILWISILRFLYFNFFSAYLMILLHQSISRFCPSCFLLLCQACLPKPLYPFVSLDSIKVISSCSVTGLGMREYQFSAVSIPNFLHIE